MITKKYNCDKERGEFEIKFSKQELGRTNIITICEYIKKENKNYEVTIFLGLSTYEEVKPFRKIQLTCNYTNLKDELEKWWKSELAAGASKKMLDFIDNVVKPTFIKEIAEVCQIYRVELTTSDIYEVEVYPDKTVYYEITSGRKRANTFYNSHNQSDILNYFNNIRRELEGWGYDCVIKK